MARHDAADVARIENLKAAFPEDANQLFVRVSPPHVTAVLLGREAVPEEAPVVFVRRAEEQAAPWLEQAGKVADQFAIVADVFDDFETENLLEHPEPVAMGVELTQVELHELRRNAKHVRALLRAVQHPLVEGQTQCVISPFCAVNGERP